MPSAPHVVLVRSARTPPPPRYAPCLPVSAYTLSLTRCLDTKLALGPRWAATLQAIAAFICRLFLNSSPISSSSLLPGCH